MTATAALLRSLDAIHAETVTMLAALEHARQLLAADDYREARRRTLELRAKSQELFEWLAESRLEAPAN
ncbi:MAG TPA: hypothetical protein VFP80_08835 [Thermoanaerobaculia bacterium]|nr:hypothetical protein [Thermoanaerobaculia bacterium]